MEDVMICVKCGAEIDVMDAHYDTLGNPVCLECATRSKHHDRLDAAWESDTLRELRVYGA